MKRKIEGEEYHNNKKLKVYRLKRERNTYIENNGGASDDEDYESIPLKKMKSSCIIVTKRPYLRVDRSNVPSYIN